MTPGGPAALVVLGSPDPSSPGHALARRAAEALDAHGVQVCVRDLDAEGFDPVARPVEAQTVEARPTGDGHAGPSGGATATGRARWLDDVDQAVGRPVGTETR